MRTWIALLLPIAACVSPGGDSSQGAGGAAGGGGGGGSGWTFTDDGVALGISGVSPGATAMPDGTVRLYVSDTSGGSVYRSAADGLTFHVEATHVIPGTDPTVLVLPGGLFRAYYTTNDGGAHTIVTATSTDGLLWGGGVSTGISDSSGSRAWGVPDAIRANDGTIRLFWVSSPGGGPESVDSATSTDGTVFLQDPGHRVTGGFVDPQILKADAGDWVAIFSTTPASPPQTLHLGTSPDGITWSVDPAAILAVQGRNAVDPTSVRLDPARNLFRVYYAVSQGSDPFTGTYELRSGVLRGP